MIIFFQNCSDSPSADLNAGSQSISEPSASEVSLDEGDSDNHDSQEAVSLEEAIRMINSNAEVGAGQVTRILFGYGFDGLTEPSLILEMATAEIKEISGGQLEILNNDTYSEIALILANQRLDRGRIDGACPASSQNQPAFAVLEMGSGQRIELNQASSSCGRIDLVDKDGNSSGLFTILRDIHSAL